MFKIKLDNKEIKSYNSFTVSKSLSNFVDTFSINISNPEGLYSKNIPVGAYINIYYEDVEIFRGICENKEVSYDNVGSTLTLSGREEFLLITEDDISPLHKDYKKVSDNFIIKDICKGYGWDFELGEAKIIKEYSISNNGVRKGQVINDVVSQNNFYIYKIGNTIYKKELPRESDYTKRKRPQFTLATQGGGFMDYNNRLLSVNISEDISGCKSNLKGFSYGSGRKKEKLEKEVVNTHLLNGRYPSRLRNLNNEYRQSVPINRHIAVSVPVKSKKELDGIMQRKKVDTDIKIKVSISVANFLDLNILDTVEIFIQDEDIKQYMYITEISYNFDTSNKFYTNFVFSPIIPIENE